jgi:trehalose/maltose hydrolase-like predicted phosphorylase
MEEKLTISKSRIEKWKETLSKYTPYDDDDPVFSQFDGEYDSNRLDASNVKMLLDELEAHPEKFIITD